MGLSLAFLTCVSRGEFPKLNKEERLLMEIFGESEPTSQIADLNAIDAMWVEIRKQVPLEPLPQLCSPDDNYYTDLGSYGLIHKLRGFALTCENQRRKQERIEKAASGAPKPPLINPQEVSGGIRLQSKYANAFNLVDAKQDASLLTPEYDLDLTNVYEGKAISNEFRHLIYHSDSGGWYVPVDFPEPFLIKNPYGEKYAFTIGSSQALLRELDKVRKDLCTPAGFWAAELSKGEELAWQFFVDSIDKYDQLHPMERPEGAVVDRQDPLFLVHHVWAMLHWFTSASVAKSFVLQFT